MGLHTGKIVGGAIVLDDAKGLEDGTPVTVWVESSEEPVHVTDEELALIRRGQAQIARGEGVDLRRALAELRARR